MPPSKSAIEREGTPSPYKLFFHGQGGSLFGIHLGNLFLTLITLGIYYFWAIARTRRFIWAETEFAGDRFAYHGTGQETFPAWFKAALFFGIPYYLCRELPTLLAWPLIVRAIGAFLSLLLILIFIPVATVGSRRYRLSRSSWRGIRFSFRGKLEDYMGIWFKAIFLCPLTLGFYTPFFTILRHKFLLQHSYLGNKKFDFDGDGNEFLGIYLKGMLLALPTLGISLIWYSVATQRYVWEHTLFEGARFRCTIGFWNMLRLSGGNILIFILSLGFALPWVTVRNMRYWCEHLRVEGLLELDAIEQDAQGANATGEELASFLDLNFDLG